MKKAFVLIFSVFFIFTIIFAIGSIIMTDFAVIEKVEMLKQNDSKFNLEKFDYSQLKGLPLIVQKYFRLNIERSTFPVRYACLKQKAEIRLDENSNWKELKAEQFYAVLEPGYVWNATYNMDNYLSMRNIETYIQGKSNSIFKLFSSLNMGEYFGEELNQSCLARFLTEAVFFPSRLLPSDNMQWSGINSQKAKVTLNYYNISVSAICHFNKIGEIVKVETDDRYKTTKAGIIKSKYIVRYSKYRTYNGLSVPTISEADWVTNDTTFTFIKSEFSDISYNTLEPFEDGTKSF